MKVCSTCGKQYGDDTQFCPDDGTVLASFAGNAQTDSESVLGKRIFGDYIIRKQLGEGGMGAVYLVENVNIDQKIAIKVLHPESAQNDELLQRFNREAKAISRLTHPNIIRVFIFGKTEEGLIYLAMEFVEGRPLRDVIFEQKQLDELRAINIMRQTLHALAEAHDLGIVHRDLKPDNIMLTRWRGVDDFVKVLDFGIAKVQEKDGEAQRKLTQAGIVYGTPEYLSPEQAAAKGIDGRSDLYSMGIILYEMMTGVVPFTGHTALSILSGHVYQEPPDPASVASRAIHPDMVRIIKKAIEKKPQNRYQNAMEFLADLEELESKLRGGRATRTTVIDVTQSSLLFEVSRNANQGAPAPAADLGATRPVTPGQPPAQAPAAPHASHHVAQRNQKILYGLVAVLSVLLITCIVLLTLFVIRGDGATPMTLDAEFEATAPLSGTTP